MNEVLIANATDPTRTLTLRKQFDRDMGRRFNRLRSVIRSTLEETEVLATQALTDWDKESMQPGGPGRFDFPRSSRRLEEFADWLQDQVDRGILEVTRTNGRAIPLDDEPWTNVYIRSSYQKGIERSRSEMNKIGIDLRTGNRAVEAAFNQPFHSERVELLFSRTFEELEGLTSTMASQVRRSLSESLAEGRGPRQAARILNNRVAVGTTRARTIARTEIIRAHHQASIREYKRAGVERVVVKAEWLTAQDERVCPRCRALEGQVFELDDIEGLIPLHPNCRCVALPVRPEDSG